MNSSIGNHVCGLHYTIGTALERVYLPQVQLKSHTTINSVCFTTQLTQTFQNSNTTSLPQVRYTFPLYDGVAVNGYTISYGSKVLKGIVKQKDVAKKTYQAAVDRGETAGLLESLPAGVFGVTLGNVPAKTDILVEITYCGELKHDAAIDGLRYILPTSIAPRYGSYPGQVLGSNVMAKGISITVDVNMASSAIRKVQSPSHPIAVSMGAISTADGGSQAPFIPSQASATLTLGNAELDEDFVLQFLIDDINKPQAILETHPTLPNQRAVMTTLVPKFTLDPIYPEIVFVADQSGSMQGPKTNALVSALKVFLKSLPLGVRFNICAFGNKFKFLWPKSQAYNEDNLNTAISFVDSFTANYGGTEILKPITAAFEQRLSDLPLEVMLLTDGEIWAEDAVFSYINEQIRNKDANARVFALGIGSDVSHTLVEGVARAGNGFAQFVTQNEETDQKVIRMLKGALYAHTKDYALEVHYDEKDGEEMSHDDDFEIVEKVNDCLKIEDKEADTAAQGKSDAGKTMSFFDESADFDKPVKADGKKADRYAHLPVIETPKILQAPNTITPLFPFNRSTVYLLLGPDSVQKKVTSVTLRATSAQGPLELNVPVHSFATPNVATIHQLAAKKAVQDLEEGRGWIQAAKSTDGASVKNKYESRFDEIVERECVRLGETFQVAGKWTSFVAVEDKEGGEERKEEETEERPVFGRSLFGSTGYSAPSPRIHHGPSGLFGSAIGSQTFGKGALMSRSAQPALMALCAAPQPQAFSMPGKSSSDYQQPLGKQKRDKRTLTLTTCAVTPPSEHSFFGGAQRSGFRSARMMAFSANDEDFDCADDSPVNPEALIKDKPRKGAKSASLKGAARSSTGGQPPRKQLAPSVFGAGRGMASPGKNSDIQTMHALINLQTFSGAWAWNEELFSSLGINEATVNVDELGGSADICATALAVAYLETNVSFQKAIWEMVVAKARGWLAMQMGVDSVGVEAIVRKAAAYL